MNNAQIELIESLIGFEGIYFETIKDEESIDTGTKVLYLERAISEDCQTFLKSLDKLYQPESNIELIRALKTINDLFFNTEVKNSVHGVKSALKHWFGGLGDIDNVDAFKKVIEELVNKSVTVISKGKESEQIDKQKENRITAEETITNQTGWRTIIDLPSAQSVTDSQSSPEPLSDSLTWPQAILGHRHPQSQSRANLQLLLRANPTHTNYQYATPEDSFESHHSNYTRPRQAQGSFSSPIEGYSEFSSIDVAFRMPNLNQEQRLSLAEVRERDMHSLREQLNTNVEEAQRPSEGTNQSSFFHRRGDNVVPGNTPASSDSNDNENSSPHL